MIYDKSLIINHENLHSACSVQRYQKGDQYKDEIVVVYFKKFMKYIYINPKWIKYK